MKNSNNVVVKIEPEDVSKEEKEAKGEILRIENILKNQSRHVEVGCSVRILAEELIEPESVEQMKTPLIYRIISKLEEVCKSSNSKVYQINC